MRTPYSKYERVYVDLPHCTQIRKIICIAEKVVYINTAAAPDADILEILPSVYCGIGSPF